MNLTITASTQTSSADSICEAAPKAPANHMAKDGSILNLKLEDAPARFATEDGLAILAYFAIA